MRALTAFIFVVLAVALTPDAVPTGPTRHGNAAS